MTRITIATLLLCVSVLWVSDPLHADFDYPDFTSTSGLVFLESAAVAATGTSTTVRITPALADQRGAVWHETSVDVTAGFSTDFEFSISPSGGADGMAFVIQSESLTAIGGPGGGCGYGFHDQTGTEGIPNSVAVELDTYLNGTHGDPDGNHASVHTRGSEPNDPDEIYSLGLSSAIPVLDSGAIIAGRVEYEPGSLLVFIGDLTTPALDLAVDLADHIDVTNAWLGFTGGTGGLTENHDLHSWSVTAAASGGFRRGDANADGNFDVSDAVFTLAALFVPGSPLSPCTDAQDANDDGTADVSDAVFTLAALFVPGSPPTPEPGGAICGSDPTTDTLDCAAYDVCP